MSLAPGTELPVRSFGPITMTDIVAYQGASGDLSPMHHDDDLARAAGYPAAFSVGMLGEVLTGTAVVTHLLEEDGEMRAELALALTDARGGVVVDGDAEFVITDTGWAAP